MNETYRGREIEIEQLEDGKWIACAQDVNGVMVLARPGWRYETEEDAIADVEGLIDQSQ
jgi:predicted RNase H-like HicB family nuclease